MGNQENACDCQVQDCVFHKLRPVLRIISVLPVAMHTVSGYDMNSELITFPRLTHVAPHGQLPVRRTPSRSGLPVGYRMEESMFE